MKKLIIIVSILFLGILCKAQTYQDSLVTNQITKEVVEKLSNDELIKLIKEIEYMKYNRGVIFQHDNQMFKTKSFNRRKFMIGFSIMIFVILLVSIPLYFNHQKTNSFHKMISGFVEKGKEIPEELVLIVYQKKSDLHKSIILISSGIGFLSALIISGIGCRIWAIGIMPVIIGIGYFISARIEK